jgi:hypothetical protein
MDTPLLYPATAIDEIAAAIVARLLAAPALAQGRVLDESDADELPSELDEQIIVSWDASQAQDHTIDQRMWTTSLRIDAQRRRNPRTQEPYFGKYTNPALALLNQAVERVMVDPTLGGLVYDTVPAGLRADRQVLDTRLGAAYAYLTVSHVTQRDTLRGPVTG